MTHEEWTEYAEDLMLLIAKSRGLVWELEDEAGAIQFLIQPRRKCDITRIRWPKRREPRETPVH